MRIRLNDLAPGVNYVLRLRSTDGLQFSEWSRAFDMLTSSDTLAPKTPTSVVGSMTGTSFNLSWAPVTLSSDNSPAHDLDHYDILVSSGGTGTTKVFSTVDTKFQFTLEMNREVFGSPRANILLQVAAVDKTGNASAYSTAVNQTNAAPANPTAFSGSSSTDSVILKWTGVADTDLAGYRVYEGTTVGSQTTLVWSGTATSATIPRIDYFTDRWYKVAAFDVFGTDSTAPPVAGPYRPASSTAADTTPPSVVSGLAAVLTNATDGKTAKAAVSWTAITDTDGDLAAYTVDYKPSSESVWNTVKVDYDKTAVTINSLLPYTNYDFRVRSGDWSANLSAWSSTVTATATANTAPATVTGVTLTPGKDSVTVKWTANTEPDVANGAGTYLVDIATNSGFTTGLLSYNTGATSISVTGLPQAQIYYARVKAVDTLGLSSAAWSTTASGTTGTLNTFNYTVASTAPGSPDTGDIWMDTTSGFEKQYNGSTWVNTGNASVVYITAKGTDLVTNGTAVMGNNYNFTTYFDYEATDSPYGTSGSFVDKSTAAHGVMIDELIAYDPRKAYKYSFQARQTVPGATNRMYGFIAPYDAAGLPIAPNMYMFQPNTTTTLAAPLNNGDLTITLTSSANWYGSAAKPAGGVNTHFRSMIIWGYTDPFGKTWPTHSYTRRPWYNNSWADGGIVGNVITLSAPWAGGSIASGTPVSNGSSGGSYMYNTSAQNVVVPETWTTYSDTFSAGNMPEADASTGRLIAASWLNGTPPGTAKIKVGWLLNYPPSPANPTVGRHAVAAVSLSDAAAAYDLATTANASANGKNKVIHSTSAASGTTGYVDGDTWFRYNGSNQIIAQWRFTAGAWVSEQVESAVIANLDAGKLTANSAFVTTLNVGTGGVIQSAGYTSGGTSGFQLSTSGLVIKGTGNTVDGTAVPDSTLSVNAIKTSTLTATTINLGATGIINVDSTGAIKSNNWANLSTGYKLDNTGLQINDGSIDAKAFRAGSAVIGDLIIGRSADALGEIKSFGYVANTTGFRLHKTGLEINTGTIKAAALQLQNGHNMMPLAYADFEYTDFYYIQAFWNPRGQDNLWLTAGAVADTTDTMKVFGNQCLKLTTFAGNAGTWRMAPNNTTYNIPVEPNGVYYLSAYMRNYVAFADSWTMRVIGNNGATLATQTWAHGASELSFTRRGLPVTIPGTAVTSVVVEITSPTVANAKGLALDGVQFEPIIGGLVQASAWKPPSQTHIDGSGVTTGFLRSANDVTVAGTPMPAWSLNKAGNLQIGDALIRGKLTVGTTGDPDGGASYITSPDYVADTSGWRIDSAGDVEFNNALIRGTLTTAASGQRFEIGLYDVLYGAANRILGFSGEASETDPGYFESRNITNAAGSVAGLTVVSPLAFGIGTPAEIQVNSVSPTIGSPESRISLDAARVSIYGQVSMPTMTAVEMRWSDATAMTLTTTAETAMGTRGGSGTFVAPPSGSMIVHFGGQGKSSASGQYVSIGFEIRLGGTVGSGTVITAYDVNSSFLYYDPTEWVAAMETVVVTGLTPGNTYNIRNIAKSGSGTTAQVLRGRLVIQPNL